MRPSTWAISRVRFDKPIVWPTRIQTSVRLRQRRVCRDRRALPRESERSAWARSPVANSRSPKRIEIAEVALAVHHQQRHRHLGDPLVGAELIPHQPPDRDDRHQRGGNVDRRGVGRFEDELGDRMLGRNGDGRTSPERKSPDDDPASLRTLRPQNDRQPRRPPAGPSRSAARTIRRSRGRRARSIPFHQRLLRESAARVRPGNRRCHGRTERRDGRPWAARARR